MADNDQDHSKTSRMTNYDYGKISSMTNWLEQW